MAVNRFYQPSLPRYTSQFVEKRLPEELILQAGAMKYGQQQQFAEDIGQISAINAKLTPGYRTTRMAPDVKNRYSGRIKDLTERFATSYDTPQAAMELSKLRNEWMNDPDVQLIQMDYELGNKERDDILRSTKTYHLDYDPNVYQQTGEVKQFNPGDPYKGYDPLVQFADASGKAFNEFSQIEPDISPIMDENGNLVGHRQFIDQRKLKPAIESMVDRAMMGADPESLYLKTRFRDEEGNLREPTREELTDYFSQLGNFFVTNKNNVLASYNKTSGNNGSGGEGSDLKSRHNIRTAVAPDNYMKKTRSMVNSEKLVNMFDKENIPFTTDDGFKNILAGMNMLDASPKEQAKALRKYIKERSDDEMRLSVERYTDPKQTQIATEYFFGPTTNGKLPANFTGGVFVENEAYDLDTGEYLTTKERQELMKEDNTVQILGPVSADKIGLAPFPNPWVAQINDRRLLIPGNLENALRNKVIHGLEGYKRAKDTKIGDPIQLTIYKGGDFSIGDVYDFGKEKDPNNLNEMGPLYIVPLVDNTNRDERGNPKVKVKVYAYNPALGENKSIGVGDVYSSMGVTTGLPGVDMGINAIINKAAPLITTKTNKGLLDNTNPYFIKEYDMSDFGHNPESMMRHILEDRDELLTRQENTITQILQ